jgi:PAS domain S-box-containing protein
MSTFLLQQQLMLFMLGMFDNANTLVVLLVLMTLIIFWLLILLNRKQRKNIPSEGMKATAELEKEILDYKYALDESSIVAITDQRGIIKYVNTNFCKISKYSREELIGQDHRIINSGYHSKEFIRQIWSTITNGKIWRGELKNCAKDGAIYWVDTTIVPFLNEQGNPYQYVAIRADITQRKLVEEEIKTLNEELENRVNERTEELVIANQELQSFNYISSHDLQEPLRKILTFAKLILEKEYDVLSERGKDYFDRIQDAAMRMQQLIADLLAFSRVSNTDMNFEKTHLHLIVEAVKDDLSESIKEKNAIIEASELCEAHIIQFQFRQLIQNLIGNALKFSSPQRPPVITVKSKIETGDHLNAIYALKQKQLSPDKTYCHITVTDNGIGFDQAYKDRIFELFQRLHEKETFPGTGIGLSIVKKIVDNHQGTILASGELDKGARFDIFIPA